ncbi:reverse transcriptase domain-containing protein [Tanacetum coccineum]
MRTLLFKHGKVRQQQVRQTSVESPNLEKPNNSQETFNPPIVTMADNHTMVQLLEALTEGYEDAIVGMPASWVFRIASTRSFYNALNLNDQDSLNSAAGGNFLDKMPRECLKIIESKSKVRQSRSKAVVAKVSTSSSTPAVSPDVAELKDMVRALILDKKNQTPAPVKAVEQSCVTCGGGHSYQNCPATDGNIYRDNIQEYVSQAAAANFNQGNTGNNYNQSQIHRPQVNQPPTYQAPAYQAPVPQALGVPKNDFEIYVKANDAVIRNVQTQGKTMQNQLDGLQNQLTNLTDMLSRFVASNTASTSGSGTLPGNTVTNPKGDLKGITTRSGVAYQGPTSSSSLKVMNHDTEVTKDTMLPTNNGSTKDVQPPVVQVQSQDPTSEPNVAPLADRSITEPIGIAKDVRLMVGKFQFPADFMVVDFEPDPRVPLILGRSFLKTSRALIDVYEACHGKSMLLALFGGFILILEALLNSEPLPPLSNHKDYSPGIQKELKVVEAKTVKSLIDEPLEVELKDLPPHLEYVFLEGDDKLPVIIAKDLKDEEKASFIKDAKAKIMRWIFLLQEFDVEIRDIKELKIKHVRSSLKLENPHQMSSRTKKSRKHFLSKLLDRTTLGGVVPSDCPGSSSLFPMAINSGGSSICDLKKSPSISRICEESRGSKFCHSSQELSQSHASFGIQYPNLFDLRAYLLAHLMKRH